MHTKTGPPTLDEIKNVSSVEEAISIQDKIQPFIFIPPDIDGSSYVSTSKEVNILALDVAYSTNSDLVVASGVLFRLGSKVEEIISEKVLNGKAQFPYIPGLLAFREIPLLAGVIEALLLHSVSSSERETKQTILLCDGAGIAHPRLCGIASHLGILYNLPSIGIAKNHLIGTTTILQDEKVDKEEKEEEDTTLSDKRGSYTPLYVKGRKVGCILRSQNGIRPIYVSPGHLVSIKDSKQIVLDLCQKYRIPEPIRRADHIGRVELKRLQSIII